ncbi:hypothetical protein ACM66B_006585 [Microbotryomycetes sp. NB124-2]
MSPRPQGIMPILAESFVNVRNTTSTSPLSARTYSSSISSSPTSIRTPSSVHVSRHSPTSRPSSGNATSQAEQKDILSCSDAVLASNYMVIRNLRSLAHPNIIRFHSFVITPSYAIIVMAHHPRLIPVSIPEALAKPYFQQLVSAVDFLHARGVTHNDIKPSNIMLSKRDTAVLIDFGFAKSYSPTHKDRFLSSLSWGTPEYLDPLRAKGTLHDERASDIWALGVTLYEIVVGRTPFEEHDKEEFLTREALEVYYERTLSRKFYGDFDISKEFAGLIRLMVEPDPNARLRVCGHALKHSFFVPQPVQQIYAPSPTRPPKSPARQKVVKDAQIKFYEDEEEDRTILMTPLKAQQTPSKTVFSPRPFILQDTNVLANDSKKALATKLQLQKSTTSMRGPRAPSRIPVRVASRGNSLALDAKMVQQALDAENKICQTSKSANVIKTNDNQPVAMQETKRASPPRPRPRLEPIVVETVFPSSAGFDDAAKNNNGRLSPAGQEDGEKRRLTSSRRSAPVAILGLRKIKSSIVNAAKKSSPAKPSVPPLQVAIPIISCVGKLNSVFGTSRSLQNLESQQATVEQSESSPINQKILSPTELRQFAEQLTGYKRSESVNSSASDIAQTKSDVGAPRKLQAPSRQVSCAQLRSNKSTQAVKIRPSLAPSFAGNTESGSEQRSSVDTTSDVFSDVDISSSSLEPSASFKRTHRRIPTNIRKVPPIYLTESGDEGVDGDEWRPDSPSTTASEISSPPQPRIVEQGRTLPTWIPKSIDSDDEDADAEVDEPTLTLSTPKRKLTKASKRISHIAVSSTSPVRPSFERMTRPSTSLSRPLTDYRPSSGTSTLHSRRSVLSLFTAPFAPSFRASTDTAATEDSIVTVASSQVSRSQQSGKVKKDGKLKKVMRKIFH